MAALGLWPVLALLWLLLVVPAWMRRRRSEAWRWPVWRVVLRGETAGRYAYLREVFEGNARVLADLLRLAHEHRAKGSPGQAYETLGWLFVGLRDFARTARARLVEWRVLSTVVQAHVPGPLPALRASSLRRPELRALAWGQSVRRGSSLRSRLTVLGWGFAVLRLAGEHLRRRATNHIEAVDRDERGSAPEVLWQRGDDAVADFAVLSQETLATAHALLLAAQHSRPGRMA